MSRNITIIILYLSYIRAACTCVRSQRKMCSLVYIDLLENGISPKRKRFYRYECGVISIQGFSKLLLLLF